VISGDGAVARDFGLPVYVFDVLCDDDDGDDGSSEASRIAREYRGRDLDLGMSGSGGAR